MTGSPASGASRRQQLGVNDPGKGGIREITDPAIPHGYWPCEFRQSLLGLIANHALVREIWCRAMGARWSRCRYLLTPSGRWREEVPRNPHTQTAWERGKVSAVDHSSSHGFGYLNMVLPAVLAVAFVPAGLPLRLLAAFASATLGWLFVPYAWAAGVALHAPMAQRNEAREALRKSVESHREAEMRFQLLEARMMLEAVPERLERFREAEEIQNERQRQIHMTGIDPRPMLSDWVQMCRDAFATGGREDLMSEFDAQWGQTAEEIRVEYNRLMVIAEAVIRKADQGPPEVDSITS